ncbi:MAG: hypothetical protein J0M08_09995 [Bacteroidetes bacterium]|nr:hypothetical protein [Bacteroidota bacterium]
MIAKHFYLSVVTVIYMSKYKKVFLLFFILLFPSVFYIILSTGKHHFIYLNYLGPKTAISKKDTAFFKIPFQPLTNHKNVSLDSSYLGMYIKVVNAFDSQNKVAYAPTMAQFVRLQEKLKDYQLVKLISISAQTTNNSIDELNAYADEVHCNYTNVKWHITKFTTPDFATTFFTELQKAIAIDTQPIALEKAVYLIDKESHIRGVYDGSVLKEINRLVDDIKILLAEYSILEKKKEKRKNNER